MKISIFGAGYVGAVFAACLAKEHHEVVVVDTDPSKVETMNAGRTHFFERDLDALVSKGAGLGHLRATTEALDAVRDSEITFICVGTPSEPSGAVGTGFVEAACAEIGKALKLGPKFHSIVFRSTLIPGTTEDLCIPLLEKASGLKAGLDFGVGYYPEFLREGSAIQDHYDPGLIVFGALDNRTERALRQLCAHAPTEPRVVGIRTAEAVKYASNCWRAVKITFANEIGNIAKAAGLDGQSVMSLVCADTKTNMSPAFLRPAFAFGGSCLPKDLRAIQYFANDKSVPTPLLSSVLISNTLQIERAENMIDHSSKRSVGLVGLSFKAGTDDIRESPLVELARRLMMRGHDVRVYDPHVMAKISNSDRTLVESGSTPAEIRWTFSTSIEDLIDNADVLVIGNHYAEATEAISEAIHRMPVVDLARVDPVRPSNGQYHGICW